MQDIVSSAGSEAKAGTPHPTMAVENLRVEFPMIKGTPTVAIRSLDVAVQRGEIFGLVGESGAGKTTLARSLLCLPPEPGRIAAGAVRFEGRDLRTMTEGELRFLRGRRISMIVPNPRGDLSPLLPVGEQIAAVARVHLGVGSDAARGMALDMLRAVQIPDAERRMRSLPHELSGGMAQRVVIAIALVCSPSFIVSDDATSGLDVTVQAQILDLLRRLAEERGSAMMFITRDIGITAHFCDRIAVMYQGEIMEMAGRTDFFFRPQHPYTVMLMAAFSFNQHLRRIWRRRKLVAEMPNAAGGCAYTSRCPLAQQRCYTERAELMETAPGHYVRCHFPLAR